MPIYEYDCSKCGQFELERSMNDNSSPSCPICNALDIKRIFGKIGVAFKGSGFYSTDSRKGTK
ncbi:MAG: hypothetical protein RL348_1251 [Bacteroidota bacterium]|jgi:putative FmdB family regulatory protein